MRPLSSCKKPERHCLNLSTDDLTEPPPDSGKAPVQMCTARPRSGARLNAMRGPWTTLDALTTVHPQIGGCTQQYRPTATKFRLIYRLESTTHAGQRGGATP